MFVPNKVRGSSNMLLLFTAIIYFYDGVGEFQGRKLSTQDLHEPDSITSNLSKSF